MSVSIEKRKPLFDPELLSNSVILKYGIQVKFENEQRLRWFPDMRLYIVQEDRYAKIFQRFKPINSDPVRMSSGFITINFAQDFCDDIHVYGMPESNVCELVKQGKKKDVLYHYYESSMGTECYLYNKKLNDKKWGHHFLKEKKMFRSWMKNSTKLHFHAPEWD